MAEYLTTLQTSQLAGAIHLARRHGSIDEQEIWIFFVDSLSRSSEHVAEHLVLPVFKILLSASAYGSRGDQQASGEEDNPPCDDFLDEDSMVQQLLRDAGLDASQNDAKRLLPPLNTQRSRFFELLSSKENGVSAKDVQGRTALSQGVAMGHDSLVRVLLSQGFEVNSQDLAGRSPLSLASINGHKLVANMLLTNGANVNWQDNDGMTPLSYTASFGHHHMVSFLVRHGGRLDRVDLEGMTPLCRAIWNGHEHTVWEMLRAHWHYAEITRDSSAQNPDTANPPIDPTSWPISQLQTFVTREKLADATKLLGEALRREKLVIAFLLCEVTVPPFVPGSRASISDIVERGRQKFMDSLRRRKVEGPELWCLKINYGNRCVFVLAIITADNEDAYRKAQIFEAE
jgi:hypothetical protein